MLNQISVGRLFDSELPYMTPLNNFIGTSSESFVRWIYDGLSFPRAGFLDLLNPPRLRSDPRAGRRGLLPRRRVLGRDGGATSGHLHLAERHLLDAQHHLGQPGRDRALSRLASQGPC